MQTTNSPHRSPQAPMNRGQSIINTPFTRDPNVPVHLPPAEVSQRDKVAPTVTHYGRSINRVPVPTIDTHNPRPVSHPSDNAH